MAETMRAVVFESVGRFSVRAVPRPEVRRDDDVLLRVSACGVCGTDLHILEDPPGYPAIPGTILGHEFVATVVAAGDAAADLRPGDRVVMEPDVFCLRCAYCARGLTNLCDNLLETGILRDGGLAEYALAPARMLHRVPDAIADTTAALTEPLACCLAAADKARILPGMSVVVLGAGPIGLLYSLIYTSAGAGQVIVVEPRPLRQEHALSLGATLVVDPTPGDAVERVRRATGIGADVVIDAVGRGMVTGLAMLRKGGSLVVFGLDEHVQEPIRQFDVTTREARIFGSLDGTRFFPQALELLTRNPGLVDSLVTHQLSLDDFPRAVQLLRAGEAIKILIRPHG